MNFKGSLMIKTATIQTSTFKKNQKPKDSINRKTVRKKTNKLIIKTAKAKDL